MAQKVRILLVCDLHDEEFEGAETVSFSLDNASYEIDLCSTHAGEMRDAFASYVGGARRAGRTASGSRRSGSGRAARSSAGRDVATIRDWARKNGHEVSERGRLSSTVLSAYDKAH